MSQNNCKTTENDQNNVALNVNNISNVQTSRFGSNDETSPKIFIRRRDSSKKNIVVVDTNPKVITVDSRKVVSNPAANVDPKRLFRKMDSEPYYSGKYGPISKRSGEDTGIYERADKEYRSRFRLVSSDSNKSLMILPNGEVNPKIYFKDGEKFNNINDCRRADNELKIFIKTIENHRKLSEHSLDVNKPNYFFQKKPFVCDSWCLKSVIIIYVVIILYLFIAIMLICFYCHYVTSSLNKLSSVLSSYGGSITNDLKEHLDQGITERIFDAIMPPFRRIFLQLGIVALILIVATILFVLSLCIYNNFMYYTAFGLFIVVLIVSIVLMALSSLSTAEIIRMGIINLFKDHKCNTCQTIYVTKNNASLLLSPQVLNYQNNTYNNIYNKLMLLMSQTLNCCGFDSYTDLNMKVKLSIYCCELPQVVIKGVILDCHFEDVLPGCKVEIMNIIPNNIEIYFSYFKYFYLILWVSSLPLLIFIIINLILILRSDD